MAPRTLIIDADHAFARDLATALNARSVETRICTDGQNGLDEARAWRPDAVVLCVELPNLSGYSVCNKLKKDDALRSIPLVLTSAEATQETFEQHRKLRTRADDYLLKPFEPGALVEAIGRLVELPPVGAAMPATAAGLQDDDLALLDRVFDELAAGGVGDAGAPEGPVAIQPATIVGRTDRAAGLSPSSPEADGLRARIIELEAEIARLQGTLQEAEAARARYEGMGRSLQEALDRARVAEARIAAQDQRLRSAEALREKARRALSVVLQALEEPAQRAAPVETPPRRE